jgi:hypothetical protein
LAHKDDPYNPGIGMREDDGPLGSLNNLLQEVRLVSDNPNARAVLTGEMPLVEINALKKAGATLEPLSSTPFTRMVYGTDAIEAYESIRKAKNAHKLTSLAKKFPTLVSLTESPLTFKHGGLAGTYSAVSQAGTDYAKAVSSGKLLKASEHLNVSKGMMITPATPVGDELFTSLLAHSAVADVDPPKIKGSDFGDKLVKRLDDNSKVKSLVNAWDSAPGFEFDKLLDKAGNAKHVEAPKVNVAKNIAKRMPMKRVLGAIPVLGALVDVGLGVMDLGRAVESVAHGEYREALGHTTNALGHGVDLAVASSIAGEGFNLAANFAPSPDGKGYDGAGSWLESHIEEAITGEQT